MGSAREPLLCLRTWDRPCRRVDGHPGRRGTHACRRPRGGPAPPCRSCCRSGTRGPPGSPNGCARGTLHTAGPRGPTCKIPAGRLPRREQAEVRGTRLGQEHPAAWQTPPAQGWTPLLTSAWEASPSPQHTGESSWKPLPSLPASCSYCHPGTCSPLLHKSRLGCLCFS